MLFFARWLTCFIIGHKTEVVWQGTTQRCVQCVRCGNPTLEEL